MPFVTLAAGSCRHCRGITTGRQNAALEVGAEAETAQHLSRLPTNRFSGRVKLDCDRPYQLAIISTGTFMLISPPTSRDRLGPNTSSESCRGNFDA